MFTECCESGAPVHFTDE